MGEVRGGTARKAQDRHAAGNDSEAFQLAFAVTRSVTCAFFWSALTIVKKFSVLGLPRGASIRCRLLLGFLSVRASSSNPMVALTRSRRMAFPTVVSPAK